MYSVKYNQRRYITLNYQEIICCSLFLKFYTHNISERMSQNLQIKKNILIYTN